MTIATRDVTFDTMRHLIFLVEEPSMKDFVVVDRDSDDCHKLKNKLEDIAKEAGLTTRTSAGSKWQVVNRIVVEELEAWYFGD